MEDLKCITGKSPQMLYRLMRQNDELAALLPAHSIQEGNKRFYDAVITDWFSRHYSRPVSNDVPVSLSEAHTADFPNTPSPNTDKESEALRSRLAALEGQITEKDKQISELTGLLTEAQRQNSQLLLLLQEEKQEKMKLLPSPKQGFWKRLTGRFKKDEG